MENGLVCITIDGYTAGFIKAEEGTLKNMYPPGWRKMC
jgi:NOL1/NOP2/fmu family ribosome biogenesis protein